MAKTARDTPDPETEGRRLIRERWAALSVPVLMVLGGFLNFALYHEYDLLAPELLVTVAGFVICGLILGLLIFAIRSDRTRALVLGAMLVAYIDIQFGGLRGIGDLRAAVGSNTLFWLMVFLGLYAGAVVLLILRKRVATILATAFSVILVTTFLFPPVPVRYGPQAIETDAPVERDLPSVVHLVLDGHIGIEGIPQTIEGGPQLRQALVDFYLSHGFRVFGRAYSRFFNTHYSISSLINPGPSQFRTWLIETQFNRWAVRENLYFNQLVDEGYAIRVYQSEYLDFCREKTVALEYCYMYSGTSPQVISDKDISLNGKATILMWAYLKDSVVFYTVSNLYDRLSAVDPSILPPRTRRTQTFSSLESLDIVDLMTADIATGPKGRVYFGHLVLPHAPFVFHPDCRLRRNTSDWFDHRLDTGLWATGTPDYREIAYVRYFDQVRCLMLSLTRVFEALKQVGAWEDVTIILHGDHGSRITLRDPIDEHIEAMSPRDMIDAYSTFYAVRAPDLAAGYDLRSVAIQDLFAEQIFGLDRETDELFVYSAPGRRYGMRRVPMVPIPLEKTTSSRTGVDGPRGPANQSQ